MIAPIYGGPTLPRGMGYLPGANALGRVAHMGYAAGSYLGSLSAPITQVAVNAGYAAADIGALSAAGATDQDIIDLLEGNTNLSQLFANYSVGGSSTSPSIDIQTSLSAIAASAGVPVSTLQALINNGADSADLANLIDGTVSAAQLATNYNVTLPSSGASTTSTASTSTAQSPPGSKLFFNVTYNAAMTMTLASSAISQLASQLPAYGMSVQSSTTASSGWFSGASFQLTILDSIGHNLITDAQSVIQSLLNTYLGSGNQLTVTFVSITPGSAGASQVPTVPASAASTTLVSSAAAASTTSLTAWVEQNALLLGLGLFALVIGAGYIKSK